MYYGIESKPKSNNKISFNEFMQDSINKTKDISKKFKSTQKSPKMFNNTQSQQIPNQKSHGTSWDVKHLDNFLDDHNWANTPSYMTRSTHYSEKLMKNKY